MIIRPIVVSLFSTLMVLPSACDAAARPPIRSKPSHSVEPGKFPDMSGYTAVNPDEYKWQSDDPGRPNKITTYGFSTPDGIGCTFGQPPAASCVGNNFPAVAPAQCDLSNGPVEANAISTDHEMWQVGDPTCGGSISTKKVLPPFHTLTVFGVTCGVDDTKMTACKDPQGRGFILSPSWSGWIPKL